MRKLSPMMSYYLTLKEEYKDAIVLFRLGDFYEMFFEDAKKASKILDLTLTGRDCGLEERAPMCGVPYHAVDGYIAKLINAGEKVAICEQLSEAKAGKGMVDRGVVRVITPGTVIEDNILNEKKNNYIAAVVEANSKTGVAWVDISTGEFNVIELDMHSDASLEDMIAAIMPTEIIADSKSIVSINTLQSVRIGKTPRAYMYHDAAFSYSNAYKKLLKQFNVASLQMYECEGRKTAIAAAGGLLEYLTDTQKRALSHLNGLKLVKKNNFMFLDSNTRRNLELTSNNRDGKRYGSLLWAIDSTVTSMGARLLNNWIEQPLIDADAINYRLDAVEELYEKNAVRADFREGLSDMRDLQRLAGKVAYDSVNPRDMLAICQSLKAIPYLKELLRKCDGAYLKELENSLNPLEDITNLLDATIDNDAPSIIRDGGFIKEGFNAELDELRHAKLNGKKWIAELEAKEKELTQIKNLKVGYNKVFGYYFEVTKSMVDKVPYRFVRKQTLANCERYTTDELKKIEDTVLGSDEKAVSLELLIFEEIKKTLLGVVPQMKETANSLAVCDVLCSFAEVAKLNNYVKPVIAEGMGHINIEAGRHPVVEKIVGHNQFIANNTSIDESGNRTMIITGPNMSGKSTYMRQVAIITLMAHIGSYVPAKSAEIGVTDRIFTRIGASDDLAFGQSTFMVEMIEVATILRNATDKSLLILDEIGRGTSTCDGLSIAWAVMEYISKNYKVKTLFSTHYHELTRLEGLLDGVRNYKILVNELGDKVIFTHRIARGGANKSFGIEVAEIAGIPQKVISRARQIADRLEQGSVLNDTNAILMDDIEVLNSDNTIQMTFLSDGIGEEVLDALNSIDTDNMTPVQALLELSNLKAMAKEVKRGKN